MVGLEVKGNLEGKHWEGKYRIYSRDLAVYQITVFFIFHVELVEAFCQLHVDFDALEGLALFIGSSLVLALISCLEPLKLSKKNVLCHKCPILHQNVPQST